MSIRSRVGIPGGTCGFDLPAYHAWQHHAPEQRQNEPGPLGRHAWPRWPRRSICCCA